MSDLAPLKVSHLSLGVADVDRSEQFYHGVLQLPTRRDGDDAVVQWPDFELVISARPPAHRSKMHFGFRVPSRSDVDAWAQRIREKGTEIVSGPSDNDGTYQLFIVDPDNYEVEIYAQVSS
jgi:catechol 2,3-dioxygenase-like lactoylglutathione lyase family enzyme